MIVPVALDVLGVYQLLSGDQVIGVPSWVWFQIALLLFLIIPFIAFHKLRLKLDGTQIELDNIKDGKPSIIVEPTKEGDVYMLKVTNIGEQAIFEAQIKLADEDPSVFALSRKSHYQACWDNTEKYRAIIPKGLSASIKIAELYSSPPQFNPLTWHLFYCGDDNRENYASTSCYFVGAFYVHENGSRIPAKPTFEYKLHIIISSTPSLREGTFQKDYVLSYERGLE